MALLGTAHDALGSTTVALGAAKNLQHRSVGSGTLRCQVVPGHAHQGPKGASSPSFENTLPPRPLEALPHRNPCPHPGPVVGVKALMIPEQPSGPFFHFSSAFLQQLLASVTTAHPH